jgi:hypothetical protein
MDAQQQHVEASSADNLGLAVAFTIFIGAALIGTLAWLGAGLPVLVLAFLGLGAALTGLFRAEGRRNQSVEEVEQP